ncbi:MAG TPA: hypothetical protein VIK79_00575, partial [Xanthobacteraceae bacterium]
PRASGYATLPRIPPAQAMCGRPHDHWPVGWAKARHYASDVLANHVRAVPTRDRAGAMDAWARRARARLCPPYGFTISIEFAT